MSKSISAELQTSREDQTQTNRTFCSQVPFQSFPRSTCKGCLLFNITNCLQHSTHQAYEREAPSSVWDRLDSASDLMKTALDYVTALITNRTAVGRSQS